MSVVAVIVSDDCVTIAGDGVSTNPDTGAVHGYISKITPLPEINAAIGVTGVGGFSSLLQWFSPPRVRTFDAMVIALPAFVRAVHEHMMASNMQQGDGKCCVVLAGWSGLNQKYEAWRVVTYAKEAVIDSAGTKRTLEPFVLHPIPPGLWATTGASEEVMRECGVIDGPEEDDASRLVRMVFAARIDAATRKTESGIQINVGGYVQLAEVTRDYIHTWVPHHWPEDVPGRPVDITQGMRTPEFLNAPATD